jgi:hypothetical protein
MPTYPLSLPSTAQWASQNIVARRAVAQTQSPFNLGRQTFDWGGHEWQADLQTLPMVEANAKLWDVFVESLRGSYGTFLMGPVGRTVGGTATGGTLETATVVGDTVLDVQGAGASATFKAGDWLQIGTGLTAALYKIMADATADGTGDALITVEPAVKAVYAISTAFTVTNPVGLWRMTGNEIGAVRLTQALYQYSFQAVSA